jgi:hypothetical protein
MSGKELLNKTEFGIILSNRVRKGAVLGFQV